jgi:hypothetical protein
MKAGSEIAKEEKRRGNFCSQENKIVKVCV